MRILHFIPSLDPNLGGPSRAVMDLCGALAARGHQVTLMTSDARSAPPSWHDTTPGVPRVMPIRRARWPGYTYLGESLLEFHAVARTHDIVHVHGMWEYANVQVSSIAQRRVRPYIISPHGMLDPWCMQQGALKKRIYLETFARRWLRGASRVHFTVQAELHAAAKYFPRESGRVVPLLMNLDSYRCLPGPQTANARLAALAPGPRVLFLSRLHPKKGLEVLLQSMRLLERRGVEVSLVVAGDGDPAYVAQLKSGAQDLGRRIVFLGMVDGALKQSLYRCCDVFALPTQQENFGLVFIEALASGLPVITTQAVGSRAELEPSGGVTFIERTPGAFATAIERTLMDPSRQARAARAREWAFATFDTKLGVQRFEQLYVEALAQPSDLLPASSPA